MDDTEKKNMDVDRLRLIDVSSEDDCLIDSPNGFSENQNDLDYFALKEVGNAHERDNPMETGRQKVQEPMLFESLEPERTRKNGKCNLRKSLAWDSAFFTSAGVLDPEELSFINGGLKKSDMHALPGIQEDIRRSAESNSTLDSDNLTLESLEVDLFEDIRASIQRSSKATNVASSSNKAGSGESGMRSLLSSRMMELASRNKMKPMVATKRQSLNMHASDHTKKEPLVRPEAVQAGRHGVRNPMSLKPPKILGRSNPISAVPTKRSSLGANRVKIEKTTKTATGRREHLVVPKKPSLVVSSENLKSTPSPKSSSSYTSGSAVSATNSTSSNSTGKSPLKFSRNKTDSKNVHLASGSILKTPLRISPQNIIESGNSRISAYLMSMPKVTSSISPVSSIDGWSSESSSSTSTVNQRSISSKTILDISSPRKGFSLERDSPQTSNFQPSVKHDTQETKLPGQCSKKASLGSGIPSHPASTNVSRSFKPSGLRMPSPKIGFFDAQKNVVDTTPSVGLQYHPGVPSGLPKNRPGICNLNGVTIKANPGKPARTVIGTSSVKFDSHQVGVPHSTSRMRPTSPAPPQERSNASPKVSSTSRTRENRPAIASKIQNGASLGTKREARKVTIENVSQDALTINLGTKEENLVHKEAIDITPTEDGDLISGTSTDCNHDNINTSSNSGEKPIRVGHLENDIHLHQKSNEKENSFGFENQVDGLSRLVGSIDLNMEELIGKKGSSLSQFDVSNVDNSGDLNLPLSNSRELVHVRKEDFSEISTKPTPLSLSPISMENIPNTRTPLSVKLAFFNRSGSLELASESMMEKVSVSPFVEGVQKDVS